MRHSSTAMDARAQILSPVAPRRVINSHPCSLPNPEEDVFGWKLPTSAGAQQRRVHACETQHPKEQRPSGQSASVARQQPRPSYLKYVSLVTLTFQNAALILWMRYVRTTPGDMFISTTAVVCAEAAKCLASLLIILIEEKCVSQWLHHLRENIFSDPWDNIKISVPSLVYTLQNNLQFLAISNLDAATYQVCYQLKILTTALFSVFMLNKQLSRVQWLSLVILFAGVACVQFQPNDAETDVPKQGTANSETSQQNWLVGMTAVVVSCMMSGFAGVYFEKILKGTKQSVWVRNVQLGFIGVLIGLVTMWINDGARVREKGFFFGYTWAVWLAVALQSFGGLLVAVVVKYADNILKGFATSAAIVLSCIASMAFLDFQLSTVFTIGASLVIVAVYLYSKYVPVTVSVSSAAPASSKA